MTSTEESKAKKAEAARETASKMAEAVSALKTAEKALEDAVSLIRRSEKNPDYIMGELQTTINAVELASRATRRSAEWIDISQARSRGADRITYSD